MSDERDPVDVLGDEFIVRIRRGEQVRPEDYATLHPHLAAQILDVFPALLMLEDALPSGDVTGAFAEAASAAPPQRLGEYRILRQIGRGGMGVVYEAVQESLGRHVAVKVLPATEPASGESAGAKRERFRREARAAARLHHTNIVPVFGVGSEGGLDFYVMQYIHGQPLDDVLAEVRRLRGGTAGAASPATEVARHLVSNAFAAPSGAGDGEPGCVSAGSFVSTSQPPGADATGLAKDATGLASSSSFARQPEARYFRACARIAHQAAEALAYAHAQGVLHRDVKPSNILLDVHGTAWVTDFGLAKLEDGGNLTRTGDIVGTLRYMAPERFRGAGDARSDVYALGITLYEMVTVRPAFDAKDRLALIERVTQTSPPARSHDRRIPRDLETIVQKAIARNSGERYADAAAFAADSGRYLNDQPIQARRQGVIERTWKWAKRRPAAAGLIAVSAVVLVSLPAVAGVLRQSVRLRAALVATEEARAVAQAAVAQLEDSTRQRLNEFDGLLIRFDARLANVRGAEAVRREFLGEVMQLSAALLAERPNDAPTRRKHGRLYQRLGELEFDAENYVGGDDAYRSALVIQRNLATAPEALAEDRSDLLQTEYLHGLLLRDTKRLPEAESTLRDAASQADRLAADLPDDPNPKAKAAQTRYRLADVLERSGRPDDALILYRQALAEQRTLAASSPATVRHRQFAALMANALSALREGADPDESQQLLEQVVRDEAAAAFTLPPGKSLQALSNAFSDLGAFLNRQRRHAGLLRLAEDMAKTLPDDSGEVYNAACYAADAASIASGTRDLAKLERAKLADAYGRRAVELLRRAAQIGYTNRDHMAEDSDLDSLRARPDFLAFWADLDRKNPGQPLTPARLVAGYRRQYQADLDGYQNRVKRAQTAAERRLVEKSLPKPSVFAPRFLRFAAEHVADPAAVEALAWVLENVEAGGIGTEQRAEALAALEREHLNKPNLAIICERLAQSSSPECDKLLRALTERHSSPDVRGTAALALAGSLGKQAQAAYAGDRAQAASMFAEAERYYETIQKEYASVVHGQGTLGETARIQLYELQHLSVGRPAQEIDGADLDGKPMKLSDYRGRVVVLDFWANWCGFCRKMYPHDKAMVKRLAGEPFAMIGVNADQDLLETRRVILRQGISWRSWWDRGLGGRTITQTWQVDGFPEIFVLDHTGVIRYRFHGYTRPDVLDAAVAELLAEANADKAWK